MYSRTIAAREIASSCATGIEGTSAKYTLATKIGPMPVDPYTRGFTPTAASISFAIGSACAIDSDT